MITSWSAVISWSSVDQWIVDQMISEKLIRWSVNSWGSVIPWAFHHMFPGLFFYLPLVGLSFLSKSSWSPNILHFLLNLSTPNFIFSWEISRDTDWLMIFLWPRSKFAACPNPNLKTMMIVLITFENTHCRKVEQTQIQPLSSYWLHSLRKDSKPHIK